MAKICRICNTRLTIRNKAVGQGNRCKRCHSDLHIDYYWNNAEYRNRQRELARIRNHKNGTARDPNGLGSSQAQIIYETSDPGKLQAELEKEMKRLKLK